MVNFIAMLSNPIYIKGILAEPTLTIIATSNVSSDTRFYVSLIDLNGKQITDNMTITMSRGTNKVETNLGDYLDAQWDVKDLQPGHYLLRVLKQDGTLLIALPIWLSEVAVSEPPTGKDNLVYYILQDKVSGVEARLPPTLSFVPIDERYNVFAYYHDGEKGRLVQFNDTEVLFDSGWGRYAILEQVYEFSTLYDMTVFMITHSYGLPKNIMDKIMELFEEGRYLSIIDLLKPYLFFQTIGRVMRVKVDTANKEIRVATKAWLGLLDRILTSPALAGCIALGGAGAYIGLSAGSIAPGVGNVIGALVGALTGCVIGAYAGYKLSQISVSVSPNTTDLKNKVKDVIDDAKKTNDDYHQKMLETIDELQQLGKIDSETADLLRNLANEWHNSIQLKLQEIEEESVKDIDEAFNRGYKTGYKEARDKYIKYTLGSGLGGVVLGAIISK